MRLNDHVTVEQIRKQLNNTFSEGQNRDVASVGYVDVDAAQSGGDC